MAVIKDMLSRMEVEHKTKLEQLHIMQEQQRCHFSYFSIHSVHSFLKGCLINKKILILMLQEGYSAAFSGQELPA